MSPDPDWNILEDSLCNLINELAANCPCAQGEALLQDGLMPLHDCLSQLTPAPGEDILCIRSAICDQLAELAPLYHSYEN